jgi:hypothetical protein
MTREEGLLRERNRNNTRSRNRKRVVVVEIITITSYSSSGVYCGTVVRRLLVFCPVCTRRSSSSLDKNPPIVSLLQTASASATATKLTRCTIPADDCKPNTTRGRCQNPHPLRLTLQLLETNFDLARVFLSSSEALLDRLAHHPLIPS